MQHTVSTNAGPITVDAAEPVPGLHVYETPGHVSPLSTYRWILAHHDGVALAAFASEEGAVQAAKGITPLADWTKTAMTAASQISLGGRNEALMQALGAAGGQHPNT